jgi:hypothetical protein
MDKKYITLFKELAQSVAASAETVMDYDREKGDEKGLENATIMRDNFQELVNRIDVTEYVISKADVAKFLIASTIITNQIQTKINALKTALAGYQTDLIPKLQDILDNASSEEEVQKMAEEKFTISEE